MSQELRLGREAIETAYALKQLATAGVRVFFYLEDRERTLDSPTDKVILLSAAIANCGVTACFPREFTMFDDPRWGDDPRSRDEGSRDLSRGSRGGSDPRERERVDPRDVFMEHVNLPRGLDREHVHYRDHDYTLRGSETRTLTTVGAFRVVPANDLRDTFERSLDPRHGELWHLRESGLVDTIRLEEEAERLRDEGANIHRVVQENELKAEYQEFLQERNRDREDSDGRPDREVEEIRAWAFEHDLPCDDQGHVQFRDVRIEYDIAGRDRTLDVEVLTPHYRGAHAAAKSSAGFTCYWSSRGVGGGGRGGGRSPRSVIEELLR